MTTTDEADRANAATRHFFDMACELIASGALPPARVSGALAAAAARLMTLHLGRENAALQLRLLADILERNETPKEGISE
jgi:hypothetical protein